ncbi:MAG: peptide deformylase [Deltaproteobacteria bacterium]|nr:peptide deformylase [Deltaproteobacteria bacterium]
MAIRTILHYPDPRLREQGQPITEIDDRIRALIDDVAETMYAAPGVGLAATQIGEAVALFVIDVADEDEPSDLKVFINPEIVAKSGKACIREGCLSFPGVSEEVDRAAEVTVRAQDRDGKPFELKADGLLAIAIQHEHDHLQGKLMIDHLGLIKRRIVHRQMTKNG